MLEVKYSFEILLISLFKILKCSFEVRNINTTFIKKIFICFLRKDYLYNFFQKIYLFVFYVI